MAFPICRFLKSLKPTRNGPILALIIVLIVGTFCMSMLEIASLERRIRERLKHLEMKNDPPEPIEAFLSTHPKQNNIYDQDISEEERHLNFPLPRFSRSKNGSVKTMTYLFAPKWIESDIFFGHCAEHLCQVSFKFSDIPISDLVLFEGRHGTLGSLKPPLRSPGQIYLYFMLEPPPYVTVSNEWTHVFNWTMSYRRDSDIWRPYGELRPNKTKLKDEYYQNALKKKTRSVAWFVSRCHSQGLREKYVKRLSKYVDVDIFGRCGSIKCGENCSAFLESYYFYLSFENSICTDYVTEKFFKTFAHEIVPVVRGGADYPSFFNHKTFIDTASFKSIEALGRHLQYLMKNKDKYIEILKEKHKYYVAYPQPWCELCNMMHNADNYKKTVNIMEWMNKGTCRAPRDL